MPASSPYNLFPAGEQEALNKLQIHGVQMDTLGEEMQAAQATLPADTVVVRVDQPLGRGAFTLLEPRFDDGAGALEGVVANVPVGEALPGTADDGAAALIETDATAPSNRRAPTGTLSDFGAQLPFVIMK